MEKEMRSPNFSSVLKNLEDPHDFIMDGVVVNQSKPDNKNGKEIKNKKNFLKTIIGYEKNTL
jgi:hypothetical protein